MSRIQKIKFSEIPNDTPLSLKYVDSISVNHIEDSYEDKAIEECSFARILAEMTINPLLGNNHVLSVLRENNLLDGYERGSYEFEDYVSNVIENRWRDYDLIETTTEKTDNKRGFVTLQTKVKTTVESVLKLADFELMGWEIEVNHPINGNYTIT